MGLEPTTISLATRCSTTELRPLGCMRLIYTILKKCQVIFSFFFIFLEFFQVFSEKTADPCRLRQDVFAVFILENMKL